MNSLGEKLRRRRLETGISLEQVAQQTKIGTRLLEAMERDNFDLLPGGVFRKKFVLQYARILGLDEAAVAAELQLLSQFDQEPNIPGHETPRFGSDMKPLTSGPDWSALARPLGSLAAVIAVILACAGLYVWWQRASAPAVSSPAALAVPAPASPAAAVPPAAQASEPPLRVEIVATELTWLEGSSDGKRAFSDSLRARQSTRLTATESIRLLVGNAGGIEVSLNGKPIGPIGPRGQVRVVELAASGVRIYPRKPPTAPL